MSRKRGGRRQRVKSSIELTGASIALLNRLDDGSCTWATADDVQLNARMWQSLEAPAEVERARVPVDDCAAILVVLPRGDSPLARTKAAEVRRIVAQALDPAGKGE